MRLADTSLKPVEVTPDPTPLKPGSGGRGGYAFCFIFVSNGPNLSAESIECWKYYEDSLKKIWRP